jgi:hypothetical protein
MACMETGHMYWSGVCDRSYTQAHAGQDLPALTVHKADTKDPTKSVMSLAHANLDNIMGGQSFNEALNKTHPHVKESLGLGIVQANAILKPTRITAFRFPSIELRTEDAISDARITAEVTGITAGFLNGRIASPYTWQLKSSQYELYGENRPDSPTLELEPGHLSERYVASRSTRSVIWELPAADNIRGTALDL